VCNGVMTGLMRLSTLLLYSLAPFFILYEMIVSLFNDGLVLRVMVCREREVVYTVEYMPALNFEVAPLGVDRVLSLTALTHLPSDLARHSQLARPHQLFHPHSSFTPRLASHPTFHSTFAHTKKIANKQNKANKHTPLTPAPEQNYTHVDHPAAHASSRPARAQNTQTSS
jgi:hypothetical protein